MQERATRLAGSLGVTCPSLNYCDDVAGESYIGW